jgi:hypothetical protein
MSGKRCWKSWEGLTVNEQSHFSILLKAIAPHPFTDDRIFTVSKTQSQLFYPNCLNDCPIKALLLHLILEAILLLSASTLNVLGKVSIDSWLLRFYTMLCFHAGN